MGDVITWRGITKLDLPPERVLSEAQAAGLQGVVIVGWDANGELYFSASMADGGEVLWLFEKAKMALLNTESD